MKKAAHKIQLLTCMATAILLTAGMGVAKADVFCKGQASSSGWPYPSHIHAVTYTALQSSCFAMMMQNGGGGGDAQSDITINVVETPSNPQTTPPTGTFTMTCSTICGPTMHPVEIDNWK